MESVNQHGSFVVTPTTDFNTALQEREINIGVVFCIFDYSCAELTFEGTKSQKVQSREGYSSCAGVS